MTTNRGPYRTAGTLSPVNDEQARRIEQFVVRQRQAERAGQRALANYWRDRIKRETG